MTLLERVVTPYHRRADITRISPRRLELLELLAAGLTDAEMGASLHLSASTVHKEVSRLLAWMRARNRPEAVARAYQRGLLVLDFGADVG